MDFWRNKIESNKKRDAESLGALKMQGWRALVVWECATKGTGKWPAEALLDAAVGWVLVGNEYSEIGEQRAG